ncbi:MAG: hypothetical protein WD737_03655 [Gemmatimonadota bacterium]
MRRYSLGLLFGALAVSCRAGPPDTLAIAERIALPDSAFSSLYMAADDTIWLGAPGALVRIDAGGRELRHIPLGAPAVPEHIGTFGGMSYFRAGPSTVRVDAVADSAVTAREDIVGRSFITDPLGRFVYRADESGAVVAHDPLSLEAVWGWPAVGGQATALAVTSHGDRMYQAVAGSDGTESALLVRDLQTGRILDRLALADPLQLLLMPADGPLLGVSWGGAPRGSVAAFHWRDGDLDVSWRRTFADLGLSGPVRAALSPSGRLLAILARESEAGLHVLDVETGRTVERLREAALDVGFGATDEVYLLARDELRRLSEL